MTNDDTAFFKTSLGKNFLLDYLLVSALAKAFYNFVYYIVMGSQWLSG